MAKTPVVEDVDFRHAVKVAAVTGQDKERDVALLCVPYGTGMMPIELAKVTVADYLASDGPIRTDVAWGNVGSGTITQVHLVTNFRGKTLDYPAAVLKAA